MTADAPSDFPYEAVPVESRPDALRRYWGIAQGLQVVDGLQTSDRLKELSRENIEGLRGFEETGELLRLYYAGLSEMDPLPDGRSGSHDEHEADFVSLRIAELLARGAFLFAPDMLTRIHAYLFQDLDASLYQPGEHKKEPLQKQELILNGDSVVYADPSLIDAALRTAFEDEAAHSYEQRFDDVALDALAKFIARLWQVHPFAEGNTRTIAVFAVLYLTDLGYDVTNEPFESCARYFRDALVRANYRNPKAGVLPERAFLVRFLAHALDKEGGPLRSRDLMVQALFDDPGLLRNVPAHRALCTPSRVTDRNAPNGS